LSQHARVVDDDRQTTIGKRHLIDFTWLMIAVLYFRFKTSSAED